MAKFAENTTVGVDKSRMEIEGTLRRYKADAFAYATEGAEVMISFKLASRWIKFHLMLPSRSDASFNTYMRGSVNYRREEGAAEKLWEQACRQKWRALALVIKAKLEAVDAGISTVEDEFLAHTVLGNGRTVSETIQEQITEHYRIGGAPSLMLTGPRP